MAISAGTVWECRQAGTVSGGGGFDASLGGTDYSQQDAVQQAYTDLASVGGATTVITSVARPFVAADVGNYIRITAGTGWTVDFFRIISVATGNATMDRAICVGGSTGGTGGFGGALRYPGDLNGIIVAGNTLWLRDGLQVATAGQAAQFTVAGSNGTVTNRVQIRGYITTRGDCTITSRATVTSTATFGTGIVRSNCPYYVVRDLSLKVTGVNTSQAIQTGTSATGNIFYNIVCTGFAADRVIECGGSYCYWRQCTVDGNTPGSGFATCGGWFMSTGSNSVYSFCWARACKGNGFFATAGQDGSLLEYCMATLCTQGGGVAGDGVRIGFGSVYRFRNCVFYGNEGSGIRFELAGSGDLINCIRCIFASNSRYGIEAQGTDYTAATLLGTWQLLCNAFYSNTLGNYFQFPSGPDDELLTADPFTDAANNDFTLNYVAGGGKVIIDAPCSFSFPRDGTTTTVPTNPGVSTQQPPPATNQTTMRSLWRLLTNEDDTTVVTNATVDEVIWRGCQAFNRITKYYTKTSTTAITLASGTQEYSLPTDFVEMIYVLWDGVELRKADLHRLQNEGVDWRNQRGAPKEFAIIGDKIIFLPIPDGEATAVSSAPTIRYVAGPPSFSGSGPSLLFEQDYPIPVYWAVVLWCAAHPDSALAVHRLNHHAELFKAEAEKAIDAYAARNLLR